MKLSIKGPLHPIIGLDNEKSQSRDNWTFPETPADMNLEGVCRESPVDSFYVMSNSEEFLGYTHTSIAYSEDSSRWEIVNTTNISQVRA